MPEQYFFEYSILQRCCKKQEAQLDTMVHSLQNTYQWLNIDQWPLQLGTSVGNSCTQQWDHLKAL